MRLVDMQENINIVGSNNSFKFSGASIDNLGADKYTLATITVDVSGSVTRYKKQIEDAIQSVIESCKKCPNLMIRVITFNSDIKEIHGFINIDDTDAKDYKINPCGGTNLFGATYDAVGSVITYAKMLSDQDFGVNGISFVITDGEDNYNIIDPAKIKELKANPIVAEEMQSFLSILIGVGTQGATSQYLTRFKDEAGFDQFININDADKDSLVKMSNFISKSISQQSKSLQTGATGSTTLTFN